MSYAGEIGLPVNSYQLILQQLTELWGSVVERSVEGKTVLPDDRSSLACLCDILHQIEGGMDTCWVCDNCREKRHSRRHKTLYNSGNSPVSVAPLAETIHSPVHSPASPGNYDPRNNMCCAGKDLSSLCFQCQNLLTTGITSPEERRLPDAFIPRVSPVPIIISSDHGVRVQKLYIDYYY